MKQYNVHHFNYFLQEMLQAFERVLEYTKEVDYAEFSTNNMLRDAVIRNFEVMGESVKHIPFGFQRNHPTIPWQKMFELRNFIVHEFFDVDDEILYEIIQTDLYDNWSELKKIIQTIS